MIAKSLLALSIAALLGATTLAQNATDKPLSEADLLKQIETLSPSRPAAAVNHAAAPSGLFDTGLRDAPTPAKDDKDKDAKKSKGPTEITSLEATFDQKTNLAIFIGEVVVKDPEFNVICDKLTAYLKSDKKAKGDAPKATPAPATPSPAGDAAKKKGGGLDHAIAITTSDRRVIITQDKVEADGSITHSLGKADKATYDAATGDVVLTGSPEVTQGINKVVAVDPGTVMTLNRDGRMKANGLTKSTIADKGDAFQ